MTVFSYSGNKNYSYCAVFILRKCRSLFLTFLLPFHLWLFYTQKYPYSLTVLSPLLWRHTSSKISSWIKWGERRNERKGKVTIAWFGVAYKYDWIQLWTSQCNVSLHCLVSVTIFFIIFFFLLFFVYLVMDFISGCNKSSCSCSCVFALPFVSSSWLSKDT